MGNLERWTLLGLDKPQAAQLAGMQPASSLKPVDSPSMPKPSCSSGSSGCTTTTTTQTSWCPPCLACTRPVHKSRARKLRAPPASRHHLCLSTKDADAQVVHRCKCIFCLTKMQEDAGAQVLASTTHRSRRSPQCTRSSCSRNDPSGKCPCERTAWTSCKLEAKTPGLWTGHPVLTFSSEVFLLRHFFLYFNSTLLNILRSGGVGKTCPTDTIDYI